jgi:5'-phosphate synthase pdxT subunit
VALRVGVVAVQGAFPEHRFAIERALASENLAGEAVLIRKGAELEGCDAAVLPGGESTTIAKLLGVSGLRDALVRRAEAEDFPTLGTCAGLILLAKEGDEQVEHTRTQLLGLMDMAVNRNAFGRQRESFEAPVEIEGVGKVDAVFIRSPAVVRTWGSARTIGSIDATLAHPPDPKTGWVPPNVGPVGVAVEQGNRVAFCFHPELTDDPRCHAYFLRRVAAWKRR